MIWCHRLILSLYGTSKDLSKHNILLRWTQVFFSTTDNEEEPIENTVENGK